MKNFQNIETDSAPEKIAFSYRNEHIIASSHLNGIYIWDMRKLGKIPLKFHKNISTKTLNLEFDKNSGLLLWCTPKRVSVYSEANFAHPVEITRSSIRNAKFLPNGSGIAVIEQKHRNEDIHLVNLYSFYSINQEKWSVKEVDTVKLPATEDVKDL